jgi:hypothetical protein
MRSFVIPIYNEIFFSRSNPDGCGVGCMWNVWERGDTVQELLWRSEVKRFLGRSGHRCKVEYQIFISVTV